MTGIPASDHRVRNAVLATLGTGCLTTEELAIALRRAGVDLGPDGVERLERVLDESTEFIDIPDGWLGVAATLDGTRWTTAVDTEGPELDLLHLYPDMSVLGWWAIDTDLTLAGTGQLLEIDDERADFLSGPRGWLEPYVGSTVEVRVDGTELHLRKAEVPEASPELVAAVTDAFAQHAVHEESADIRDGTIIDLTQIGLDNLLWYVLASHREVVRAQPIPPIDVLLAAAGLERDAYSVLRAGANRDELFRWRRRQRLESEYGLVGDQIDRAEIVIGMSVASASDRPEPFGPPAQRGGMAITLAAALADPDVCRAVLDHHRDVGAPMPELATFARTIIDHLPSDVGAAPRWLEGRALDLGHEPQRALAAFEEAVATEEDHPLALLALAAFRSDAGDAAGAAALLRRAGVDEEMDEAEAADADGDALDLMDEVLGWATHRPRAPVGRNEPCPCGSGRKYKACHLGRERHELVERGTWLYAKAHRYVRDHHPELIAILAAAVSEASEHEAPLVDLLESRLIADIALHEGDVDAKFVADRDAFLPDDEALLAARWELTERSLFQVEEVGKTSLRMRDVRSGESVTVTNMTPHPETRRGDLMLGRPLPVGDTWRIYSGLVKVVALRGEALDALDRHDPFAVAEIIGRCLAPPAVQNTDGDPMEWHELLWKLPDPEAARRALIAHDALTASHDSFQLVRDTAGQRDTVVLTLTIAGDELRGAVNSERRAEEVLALVGEVLPAAELVDHDRRTADEMRRTRRDEQAAPRNLLDDPEHADLREDLSHQLERQWLDEHVPALGGLTPRQAAEDPIARHDLERLLDSFEGRDGLMDIPRLRQALGL